MSVKNSTGFTLIELIIVIGVLGLLAAAVLIAIDPIEQLTRGRDTGRKSSITQMGRAMEGYVAVYGNYVDPLVSADWIQALVDSGDLKLKPKSPSIDDPHCTTNLDNNFCYSTYIPTGGTNTEALMWVALRSKLENKKCAGISGTGLPSEFDTYYAWSSALGGSGVVCYKRNIYGFFITQFQTPQTPGDAQFSSQ
jgi:prepilin-type N-terminal cleavage/methylation domain-containing protein